MTKTQSSDQPVGLQSKRAKGPCQPSAQLRSMSRSIAAVAGTAFAPDVLKAIFEAFDGAWGEITSDVGTDPRAIEVARLSLATIVLSLASAGPVDRNDLKGAAVDAYRLKHRL